MKKTKDFYTVQDFADFLQVHPTTIRRGIKNGRIQAFRVGQGKKASWRIAHSEINRMALFDLEEVIENIIDKKKDGDLMDWAQFATLLITILGMFFWNRSESRQDIRHMDTKLESTRELVRAIFDETKDFHNRLCKIEEDKKK